MPKPCHKSSYINPNWPHPPKNTSPYVITVRNSWKGNAWNILTWIVKATSTSLGDWQTPSIRRKPANISHSIKGVKAYVAHGCYLWRFFFYPKHTRFKRELYTTLRSLSSQNRWPKRPSCRQYHDYKTSAEMKRRRFYKKNSGNLQGFIKDKFLKIFFPVALFSLREQPGLFT